MKLKPALALPEGLECVELERSDGVLMVTVVSTQESTCCPLCGVTVSRVQNHYRGQVADLRGEDSRFACCSRSVSNVATNPPVLKRSSWSDSLFLLSRGHGSHNACFKWSR